MKGALSIYIWGIEKASRPGPGDIDGVLRQVALEL